MSYEIPEKQDAVQLIGPNELTLNQNKSVYKPNAYQILGKVEASSLCFSDLKLLKQFGTHARKTRILSGIEPSVLKEIPSYVPDDEPTVPGHETVVRICAVGEKVQSVKLGQRCLVQTDYRWLPTANSNGSFGYSFEGGLQEYVLMDERAITSPENESMLIDASEDLSAAAVALVEPWACAENAYVTKERCNLAPGGKMLVVVHIEQLDTEAFKGFLSRSGKPGNIAWIFSHESPDDAKARIIRQENIDAFEDGSIDDIVYFGSDPGVIESLFVKLATRGLFNIVLCNGTLGRDVVVPVGRVHYGGIRIVGTAGCDPVDSLNNIPATGEIRPGDTVNVIGAAGPMGIMHVVRNICQGVKDVTILAGDLDDQRLAGLNKIAQPLAEKNDVSYKPYNPTKDKIEDEINYAVIMAPIPKLVENAIKTGVDKLIINVFAGIPASVSATLDLQRYIEKRMHLIGTSGSTLDDIKTVLAKVEAGRLDTNVSVAAICGLDGAVDGIRAVEKQSIPGKIVVYPSCKGLGLTTLDELTESMPDVAGALTDGFWNRGAEDKLLELRGRP